MELIKLENGLTVIMSERKDSKSTSMILSINTGSIHEEENNNGISHFIEHMLFKGTKTRSSEEITGAIEEAGGDINALTTKSSTEILISVPYNQVDTAINTLIDIITNSEFKKSEIEKEKEIILSEAKLHMNSDYTKCMKKLSEEIYISKHRMPIIGTPETIMNFSRKELIEYYKKNYVPSNMIFAISGKFNKKEVLKQLKTIEKGETHKNEDTNMILIDQDIEIREKSPSADIAIINQYYRIDSAGEYDAEALILNEILTGNTNSYLFRKIREELQLSYGIDSGISFDKKSGLLSIHSAVEEERIEEYEKAIEKSLKNLTKKKVIEPLIEYNKKRILGRAMIGFDINSEILGSALEYYKRHGELLEINKYIENFTNIKSENVIKLVNEAIKGPKYKAIITPEAI